MLNVHVDLKLKILSKIEILTNRRWLKIKKAYLLFILSIKNHHQMKSKNN
jgi:hypothetical protein